MSALEADWLDACRRAAEGLRAVLRENPTSRERVIETGTTGEGGDRTLVVDYGDPGVRVVVDPIDGSMNAKRGLTHHALSIAISAGPTMGDVVFGYVHDLGPEEEWWARRGEGAWLDGERLNPPDERRTRDGRLELVAIESASPRWIVASGAELERSVHRVRAIGSIAISLCQVAAARVDGMATLWRCRAVDAAAAQLIVRESGGLVAFTETT